MRQSTLIFVMNPKEEILLAMKKRGFGEGKWNGAGGKVEAGETVEAAAVRELREETGIDVPESKLESVGILHFTFEGKPDWNQDVNVFFVRDYVGPDGIETEEMRPEWFTLDKIPFDDMWADDPYWLPRVLEGDKVDFSFTFDADGDLAEVVEGYVG
ncbi:MAG: 8-oxo-dGTP diphosphatase / 2-hydroxy-dATP diphosphatase [Patescibacteria group bacterium]|nr:8-oxo-dGTP diphosphatase / 2-hydroxy-dATP diphosphatase [Patescibacteria group bacterium]